MADLLVSPGAPYFALSLAGALIAALAGIRIERARLLITGIRMLPSRRGAGWRLVIGHAAALPLCAALLLTGLAFGASGRPMTLLVATALAVYLYLGVALPRRPLVRARRENQELRRLTPGFASYVRVALAGYESPMLLLERYVARERLHLRPMQRIAAEALGLARERRLRPFDALRTVARERGCRELTDVAHALAQAEAEGTSPEQALQAHETTLEAVLRDEFSRMLKRRTLWLLLVVAASLVIGILGNLLYVMVAGSSLFGGGL